MSEEQTAEHFDANISASLEENVIDEEDFVVPVAVRGDELLKCMSKSKKLKDSYSRYKYKDLSLKQLKPVGKAYLKLIKNTQYSTNYSFLNIVR